MELSALSTQLTTCVQYLWLTADSMNTAAESFMEGLGDQGGGALACGHVRGCVSPPASSASGGFARGAEIAEEVFFYLAGRRQPGKNTGVRKNA